jgi:hypothetical protein
MYRPYHILLGAVIIVLMLTAGCTFFGKTAPSTTIPETSTAPTGVQGTTAPAAVGSGQNQPAAGGNCTQGMSFCSGDNQCHDLSTDIGNCGNCGYACPANSSCQSGQCYCKDGYEVINNQCIQTEPEQTNIVPGPTGNGCPAGMTPCPDGYCYELTSSSTNCGVCGNQCSATQTCSAASCVDVAVPATATPTAEVTTTTTAVVTTTVTTTTAGKITTLDTGKLSLFCPAIGKTSCGGVCVDTLIDPQNCGACDKICKLLTPSCCNGHCVNLKTDSSNCGTCGHVCPSISSCSAGSCSVKVVTLKPVVTVAVTAPKVTLVVTPPLYQPPPDFHQPIGPGF